MMASPHKDAQTHMLAATASAAAAVTAHLPTLQGFVYSSAVPAAGSPNTITPAFTGLVDPQIPLPLLMLLLLHCLQGFVYSSTEPAAGSPNTITPAFTGLVNPHIPLPLLMLLLLLRCLQGFVYSSAMPAAGSLGTIIRRIYKPPACFHCCCHCCCCH
jgi:hypothetical protein